MRIVLEREVDPGEWATLLAGDAAASFFHLPGWARAFCDSYPGFNPFHLLARDGAGRLLGALPGVRSRRGGLIQILSLPFGTYGTPLVSAASTAPPAEIRGALIDAWRREAGRPGVVRAHFVPFTPDGRDPAAGRLPGAWRQSERTHIIPLDEGFEAIWFGRYDKENRTASRKAVRLGVVVAPEPGKAGVDVLEDLYRRQTAEWPEHNPYRPGFFHRIFERTGDRCRVWVARREGAAVFAVMAFYHNDTVTPWVSGNTADARALCAGNLIHKVLIEDACSRGYAAYNFGGSGGVSGIEAFKVAFGGAPVDYAAYLHEAPWFGRLRGAVGRVRRGVQRRLRGMR